MCQYLTARHGADTLDVAVGYTLLLAQHLGLHWPKGRPTRGPEF